MGKYDVGTLHKCNNGEEFEIIDSDNSSTKTIKFLKTNIVKKVFTSNIKKGTIESKEKDKYNVGKVFMSTHSESFVIIEYIDKIYRKIKFLDSNGYETNCKISHIGTGNICNPYRKSTHRVGYLGVGKYNSKKHRNIYDIWVNIISRCYNEERRYTCPTYKGIVVCKEWLNFQVFAEWYDNNYPKNIEGIKFELDKDLLQQNVENKVYSPESCLFLPKKINSFLSISRINNTSGFTGVNYEEASGKCMAIINNFDTSKQINLGRFSAPEEASQAYKTARAINAEKAKQYLRDLNYLPESIIQLIK